MLRLALICFTNSGIRAARMTMVRPMIDSAHEAPPSGSSPIWLKNQCQESITPDTA